MEGEDSECYPAVGDDDNDEGISNHDAIEGTSTAYEKRKQKAADGWNAIRDSLLHTAVETHCILTYTKNYLFYIHNNYRGQKCGKCQSEEATVYCKDCGPFVYLCQACTVVIHNDPLFLGNAFHLPQLWTAVLYHSHNAINFIFCMFKRAISRDSNIPILHCCSHLIPHLV